MESDPFQWVVDLLSVAEETGDSQTLIRATTIARDLASRYPLGSSGWTHAQVELARCLALAYRIFGDVQAAEEQIGILRRTVTEAAFDDVTLPSAWNNLGNAMADRYLDFGDESALPEAEASFREALAAPTVTTFQRPVIVGGLTDVILQQTDRLSGDDGLSRIRDAVDFTQSEVGRMPSSHPAYPTVCANLARLLIKLYKSTSDNTALTEAERVLRAAIGQSSLPVDRSMTTSELSEVLHLRWSSTGESHLFDDALDAGLEALRLTPPGRAHRETYLHSLATLYVDKYLHGGGTAVLDTAADYYRQALESTEPGAVNYPTMLNGLAETLMLRFHAVGDERAMNESIELHRHAADRAMTAGMRCAAQTNLAGGLVIKYGLTRDLSLLDEAQRCQESALPMLPASDVQRYVALSMMGNIHYERFFGTGDARWLEEAEPWFRGALEAASNDSGRAHAYADLGRTLHERLRVNGDKTMRVAAVEAFRNALRLTPPTAVARGGLLADSARALLEIGLDEEALAELREAARLPTTPPRVAVAAARQAGRILARHGDTAGSLEMYRLAVRLLLKVAPRGLARADQERQLGDLIGLAGEAAAAAIEAGDVAEALVLVETARGILLSQALELRDTHDNLHTVAPELADRFEKLLRALNAGPPLVTETALSGLAVALATHSTLAGEFDTVLANIRRLDGFHDFLGLRSIESILDDAGSESVVVLVLGARHAYAILLRDGRYLSVPLPGVTSQALAEHTEAFLTAQGAATDSRLTATQQLAAENKLHDGLAWLWDNVAEPVIHHCGTRMWWIPTGLFALLPIHAAGRHRESEHHRSVFDTVVSSYAPTIRALGRARRMSPPSAVSRTLVVAVPDAPALRPLEWAEVEASRVAALAPEPSVLAGVDATREAILRRLANTRYFHYAGHAASSLMNGASARLLPYDWQAAPLTAIDVAALSLTDADLAFLGGCDTAMNGIQLADEAVTIATAFHLAGFRHVIAGMWSIDDKETAALADHIWGHVRLDGTADLAHALNGAILEQRHRWPLYPSIWAGYLHVGT